MTDIQRKRLLIVDDDAEIRLLFRVSLDPHFEVFEAKDGRDALQVARHTAPDVVLLDLMLPIYSGFDVLTALRRSPQTAHATIVMLTASDSPDSLQKGLALGADLFLTKPMNTLALKQLILSLDDSLEADQRPQ